MVTEFGWVLYIVNRCYRIFMPTGVSGIFTPNKKFLSPTSLLKVDIDKTRFFLKHKWGYVYITCAPSLAHNSLHAPVHLLSHLVASPLYNLFHFCSSKFRISTRKPCSQHSKCPKVPGPGPVKPLKLLLVQKILDDFSLALEQQTRTENEV